MNSSIDLEKAILFVQENGTILEKARLLRLLMDMPAPREAYQKLVDSQNADGGFPSRPRPGSASALDSTLTALWQFDELGLFEHPSARAALGFLLAMQRPDGGWDENPGLPEHDLPPWIRPGEMATRLYLSTYAAYWLGVECAARLDNPKAMGEFRAAPLDNSTTLSEFRAPPLDNPTALGELRALPHGDQGAGGAVTSQALSRALARGAAYIAAQQEPGGKIPGYMHNNWLGAAALLLVGGYAQHVEGVLDYLRGLPPAEWADSQVAWALDCLTRAGLPAGHPMIAGGLAELIQRQDENGGWASEDGPSFAASATVGVLKVLKTHGLIEEI